MTVNKLLTRQRLLKPIFVFVGLAVVIYVIISFVSQERFKTTSQHQVTPVVYEEVKNGKYINYKYGFSFEYPKDIFTDFNKLRGSESFLLRSKEEGGLPEYDLRLGVRDEGVDEFYEDYNRKLLVPKYDSEEEKNFAHNEIIVKKLNTQGYLGYIEYGYLTPYARDIGASYYHNAKWLVNDKILSINLITSGDPDTKRQKRLDILNSIVDSLEFFEPEDN